MLSCGQACTQSRHIVQSRLPTFIGRKSPSSQPRCATCPACSRTAFDAIRRPARSTRLAFDDAQFGRRHRRGHEVELADGAEVLAERRALENRVDDDGEAEVAEHEPRRRARLRPQIEQLVREQHEDEQGEAQPLAAQPSRPAQRGMEQAPAHVAREHHRAGGAEQIADGHDGHDEEATPVDRGEDGGQIPRRELRTEQAVQHDRERDQEQQSCSAGRRDASGETSRRRAGAGCSCARKLDGRR